MFPVHIPPLRDRPQDLAPLAASLLTDIATELGLPGLRLSSEASASLVGRPWRGNVRGLRNALERAAILADGDLIEPGHLASPGAPMSAPSTSTPATLEGMERQAIVAALAAVGGNRREAAERLDIGLRTLYDKLKRYGLK